jgi:hypothetical protein
MNLEVTPGRYRLPLSDRWTLVALVPVSGVVVLGLFLDGDLVELVDDPLDVLGYLRASALVTPSIGTTASGISGS